MLWKLYTLVPLKLLENSKANSWKRQVWTFQIEFVEANRKGEA